MISELDQNCLSKKKKAKQNKTKLVCSWQYLLNYFLKKDKYLLNYLGRGQATLIGTQSLLLALQSGITLNSTWRTKWGTGDYTWSHHIKGMHPIHCTISPNPGKITLFIYLILDLCPRRTIINSIVRQNIKKTQKWLIAITIFTSCSPLMSSWDSLTISDVDCDYLHLSQFSWIAWGHIKS